MYYASTLWLWITSPWYRWPIEIEGLPIKNGDFPWQTVSHNQRTHTISRWGADPTRGGIKGDTICERLLDAWSRSFEACCLYFMLCVQPKVGRYIFIYIYKLYTYNHIYIYIIYSNPPKIEKMKTVKIWNAMIYIITSSKHTIYLWTPIRRHNVNINGMPHSKWPTSRNFKKTSKNIAMVTWKLNL